ncbi:hypothetical protein [Bradyrhizobium sp. USDA 4473]
MIMPTNNPPPIPTPATRKAKPETLLALVEMIASGVFSVSKQAEALHVHPGTIQRWLVRSNSRPDDPDFLVSPWGEPMSLAKACVIARKLGYQLMRARAEEYATFGRMRKTIFQGQNVPALDPAAYPLDRETRILCGFHPDALMLDGEGRVIWNEEWEPPSVAILERFFVTQKDLTPTSKQQIQINGQVAVGVGVMGRGRYDGPAPEIPPEPVEHALPEVEVIPALAPPMHAPSITAEDLDALLGPEPEPAAIAAAMTETIAPEPEPQTAPTAAPEQPAAISPAPPAPPAMASEPDPDGVLNGPSKPVTSELQRSLLAKLEEARARARTEQAS